MKKKICFIILLALLFSIFSVLPAYAAEGEVLLSDTGVLVTGITNAVGPTGAGSRNINVIVDGKTGFSANDEQYDSYGATLNDAVGADGYVWFGASFSEPASVSRVVFWHGGLFWDGGWFGEAPKLQVLQGGEWKDVNAPISPAYPEDTFDAQAGGPASFTFVPAEAVECEAVRVIGPMCKQAAGHSSCAEIEVYVSGSKTVTELRSIGAVYTALTNVTDPAGAGSRDTGVIVDGKKTYTANDLQFDSFAATLNDGGDRIWFGAGFDKEYLVSAVQFWEGCHFPDGGWFSSAPVLQVLQDGEWKDAGASMRPAYPANSYDAQLPVNSVYSFALPEAVRCSGIRVIGAADGFASCTELCVFGTEVPAEEPGTDPVPGDEPGNDPTPATADPIGLVLLTVLTSAAVPCAMTRRKKTR